MPECALDAMNVISRAICSSTDKPISDIATTESLTHLSTNQRIHVYKETPEEGLIQKYKENVSNSDKDKSKSDMLTLRGSLLKQSELLAQDYVKKLLGYLIDLGPHFVHTKSFKLAQFHDDMMSSYGGVRVYSF